ncbi:hypothetical protein [Botrimarina hoheduenensis]|uniref:PEP-CTERM protein-sorting domain-containing protein n=1 Tax=Botrimarina hoheduenensis TaxID=2528000 RepID=A0A5C5VTV1_9BACT|nr:hypothetical protein [Botrimarina hoheduenensis]TWT41567.1 hypothetical protein Pla111_29440 [Botrimarina hoheduenensis]
MQGHRYRLWLVSTLLVLATSSGSAERITVIDTGAANAGGASTTNAQGFTLSESQSDVEISIGLRAFGATIGAEVYLSTQVGPGTNSSHVVAQFQLPPTPTGVLIPLADVLVFQGLMLEPGQYFVSLGLNSGYTWGLSPAPGSVPTGIVTGRAAAFGSAASPAFAPASSYTFYQDFTHRLLVTSSGVPEPSGLMLAALLTVGLRSSRCKRS